MKLITEKGELALPSDFQFDIEENNPFFSQEGAQSIPATLPLTPDTAKKLGFIHRPNIRSRALRKLNCTLMTDVIHKHGKLIVESVEGASITGAIMLNESDLYSSIKDDTLKEIFSAHERNLYSVYRLYYLLLDVYKGVKTDDFAVFPVATNKTENGYNIINCPDPNQRESPHLIFDSREIYYKDGYATVPIGFGISPFLWLYRVIEMIFEHYGYEVQDNKFRTDEELCKIVLLNNCTDSIVKGKLNYSDLVPDCTVSDFIEFLNNKFHAAVVVNPEAKLIDIQLFEDCISLTPTEDLSAYAEKSFKTNFVERKSLCLKGNSIDDYPAAAETYNKLVEKYSAFNLINETQAAYQKQYYYRKATMEYYDTTLTETWEDVKSLIGGSNFELKVAEGVPEEKIEFSDPFFRMIIHSIGENADILMPYIGEAIYNNTLFNGEKVDGESQDILICYAAGAASPRTDYLPYFYGTAGKYDNLGNEKFQYSLYTQDIYARFWAKYATLLLNQTANYSATVRYPIQKIIRLDITSPKMFHGVPVIITARNIQVGDNISYGESSLMPIRLYEPIEEYAQAQLRDPVYVWEVHNDLIKELSNYSFDSYEIKDFNEPEEFASLPEPTEEQYLRGDRYHEVERNYTFTYTKGSDVQHQGTLTVTWWVQAVWG